VTSDDFQDGGLSLKDLLKIDAFEILMSFDLADICSVLWHFLHHFFK